MDLIERLRPTAVERGLARFGASGDGGYLMPDDLDGVRACISPGVSVETSFDEAMAARGIDVIMADGSVPGPPRPNPRFHFQRKFVGLIESDTTTTLDALAADVPQGDLILQMDIEGAEYLALASASTELIRRFRIMVIEFHQIHGLLEAKFFAWAEPVFSKILQTHAVVHIHPNNHSPSVRTGELEIPKLMEFTFYRRDRDRFEVGEMRFPHPLDADNVPSRPPLPLPACWRPRRPA